MIKVSFYYAVGLPDDVADRILEYSSATPASYSNKLGMINAVKRGIGIGNINITSMDPLFLAEKQIKVFKNESVDVAATINPHKVKPDSAISLMIVYRDDKDGITPVIVRTFDLQRISKDLKKIHVKVEKKYLQSYVYEALKGEKDA